jgi:hypothetical protein
MAEEGQTEWFVQKRYFCACGRNWSANKALVLRNLECPSCGAPMPESFINYIRFDIENEGKRPPEQRRVKAI